MHLNHLIISAALLTAPGLTLAGPCDKIAAQDALERCLQKEFDRADQQLNHSYNALRKRLDKDAQEMLKKAQRAWLAYRDSDCDFQSLASGNGPVSGQLYTDCRTEKTRRRIEELEHNGW